MPKMKLGAAFYALFAVGGVGAAVMILRGDSRLFVPELHFPLLFHRDVALLLFLGRLFHIELRNLDAIVAFLRAVVASEGAELEVSGGVGDAGCRLVRGTFGGDENDGGALERLAIHGHRARHWIGRLPSGRATGEREYTSRAQ